MTSASLDQLKQQCKTFVAAGNFAEALIPAEAMLQENPESIPARKLVATILLKLGALQQALPHVLALISSDPSMTQQNCIDVAKQYQQAGSIDASIQLCELAANRFKHEDLWLLAAANHYAIGAHKQAMAAYDRALAINPQNNYAVSNRSLVQLMLTDFADGLDKYTARISQQISSHKHTFNCPLWQGESLEGRKLLLWEEQGLGDIVMFATFLPYAIQQGATIAFAAVQKFVPLFARSFSGVEIISLPPEGGLEEISKDYDFHAPIGELMHYFYHHYKPADHAPVFQADSTRSAELRKKYKAIGGNDNVRLIGFSWETHNPDSYFIRNIPLIHWKELFELPNTQWISLQYGEMDKILSIIGENFSDKVYVDSDVDAYKDTDALAAQIDAMDEIVSIQNANVHLAGSLGVPATLLLSAASDWRWGLNHASSHFYQSITILRQQKILDWQPVMQRACAELSKRL